VVEEKKGGGGGGGGRISVFTREEKGGGVFIAMGRREKPTREEGREGEEGTLLVWRDTGERGGEKALCAFLDGKKKNPRGEKKKKEKERIRVEQFKGGKKKEKKKEPNFDGVEKFLRVSRKKEHQGIKPKPFKGKRKEGEKPFSRAVERKRREKEGGEKEKRNANPFC